MTQETLLKPHEENFPEVEKMLRIALRFLLKNSSRDSAVQGSTGYAGLSKKDIQSPFFESLSNRQAAWTAGQIKALYSALTERYVGPLTRAGIPLPPEQEVTLLITSEAFLQGTKITMPKLDIRDKFLYLTFPYPKYKIDAVAYAVRQHENNWCRYTANAEHEWQLPLTETNVQIIVKYFPVIELTASALAYKKVMDEKAIAAAHVVSVYDEARTREYNALLAMVNNLEGELAPGYSLFQHQKEAIRAMLWRQWFIIGDEVGAGKAQPLDAKILTPDGWKCMGDMKVGSKIIGGDGKKHAVTGVYPQGKKSIYRVTMSDGSSTECCDEHLWTVNTPVRKHRGNPAMIVQLKDIMYDLHDAAGKAKWHIPLVQPVQFEEQSLPLNPYALGLLLGNGSLSVDGTVHFTSSDSETVVRLSDTLPSGMQVRYVNRYDYAVTSPEAKRSLPAILRELGLSGHKSITKFIPVQYQFASVESRIALLQGLLDTDSYVGNDKAVGETPAKKGSNIEYSTSSEQLAKDVIALVQSLGGVAYVTSRIPHYTHKGERREGQRNYRVNIALPAEIIPFRLERRRSVYQPRSKYQPTRAIVQVEYIGEQEAQCIRVDAADHLYVTDDYIVTHNTIQSLVPALALQRKYGYRVYIISTKSSLDMWTELADLFGVQVEVFGWAQLLAMEFKDNKKFTQDFVLIADEVHHGKSGSQRSKKYLAFAALKHCKAHYAMSGSIGPNGRPIELYNVLIATRHPLVYSEHAGRVARLKMQYLNTFCGRHRKKIGSDTYAWDVNGATNLPLLNSLLMYTPGSKDNHRDACLIARLKEDFADLPEKIRVMLPVEVSAEALKVFTEAMAKMWKDYNEKVEEKIALFKEKHPYAKEEAIRAERRKIANAQALVSSMFFRHAGALAKVETTLEYARMVASKGHKTVIFTAFTDVAKIVGAKLEEEFGSGSVGYIVGEMDRDERSATMASFQDKHSKMLFIICTSAGGESITLTAAQHMLIIDRMWSPKEVVQWEGRCHRMSTTGTVTIYWLQLPKEVTEADSKIDDVLQAKQANVDMMQFGKVTTGMQFLPITSLEDQAEAILYVAYMQTMHAKKKK